MYYDFIIRLKNASLARKKNLVTPYANLNKAIGKALVREGFLDSVKDEIIDGHKTLSIDIRYQNRRPAITDVSLVSKPSIRKYVAKDEIRREQGFGTVVVLSTNQGVMTGRDAIKKGIGGELLFKIW